MNVAGPAQLREGQALLFNGATMYWCPWPRLIVREIDGRAHVFALDQDGRREIPTDERSRLITKTDGLPITEALAFCLDWAATLPAEPNSNEGFAGGWVAAFSFELGRRYLPSTSPPSSHQQIDPDAVLSLHAWISQYHPDGTITLCGRPLPGSSEPRPKLEDLPPPPPNTLAPTLPIAPPTTPKPATTIKEAIAAQSAPGLDRSLLDRSDYLSAHEILRDHIFHGRVYQANLCRIVQLDLHPDPTALFRKLRQCSHAPNAAHLHLGDRQLLSASPECFLRIRAGQITTEPIKGTSARPINQDPTADDAAAAQLLASSKDRSECMMIVDLMRNDLSRVCRVGTVQAENEPLLRSFATVHHLIGKVSGTLIDPQQPSAWLRATMPPGSVSGCPKIAALSILDQLEKQARGFYTGCFGWIAFGGNAELAVTIRSAILDQQGLRWGAGGGITWGSESSAEWEELWAKTRVLAEALPLVAQSPK